MANPRTEDERNNYNYGYVKAYFSPSTKPGQPDAPYPSPQYWYNQGLSDAKNGAAVRTGTPLYGTDASGQTTPVVPRVGGYAAYGQPSPPPNTGTRAAPPYVPRGTTQTGAPGGPYVQPPAPGSGPSGQILERTPYPYPQPPPAPPWQYDPWGYPQSSQPPVPPWQYGAQSGITIFGPGYSFTFPTP